jgi:hypothetical protein
MKRYLVKLNTPVLIEESTCDKSKKTTIYGFLGPYEEEYEELNACLEHDLDIYVDYLAAMNEQSGALTYTVSLIDLEEVEGECLICGLDKSFIICDSLMDNLTRLAEQQKVEQFNVVLFNHPIWLPKRVLWEEEEGFCHIYGLIVDKEIDRKVLQDCNLYLGYLAMVEEVILNDVTPSGYTADVEKDGLFWYDRGEEYSCVSERLKREGLLCQHKHNLKLRSAVVRVPEIEINKGVRDEFILSQELYELLVGIVAKADHEVGCPD